MYLRKCLVLVYGAMVIPFVGISADNVNVALHKPVIASSQQKEFPASNVTDGVISRNSSWTSAKGARTPHILDLNLQKYYDIDRIVIGKNGTRERTSSRLLGDEKLQNSVLGRCQLDRLA
mgnify:CR=1 FL=1